MAKIHTHYDNLKVARMAPQEVIRAAYKALSQKYHPDKNPGDDKAARIMAIVNTAYGILADPVRRKEHDEWIAAEEWEIAWLESTSEEGARHRDGTPGNAWETPLIAPPARSLLREPTFWLALTAVFAIGAAAGALALSSLPGLRTVAAPLLPAAAVSVPPAQTLPVAPSPVDDWAAAGKTVVAVKPPNLQALAVTELVVPAHGADCSTELRTSVAPNGSPWPDSSGYIDGYAVANQGVQMRVEVDNAANDSNVFVRLIDLERGASVRHAYVLAHESLSIDKLVAGRYEVRYQNVDPGGLRGACTQALKQAAAAP